MTLKKNILIILSLIIGTAVYGQNIDSLQCKKIADSLMKRHSVNIPLEYIEKVDFKYLVPGEPVNWCFRNFKNHKFTLDTLEKTNYAFIYHYQIGEFSGETISIIISEDNNSDSIEYYFPETPFLFLKSIMNKEKSFAVLTKNNVIELLESNGEVKIDSIARDYDWHFEGWDTLAKNTYFSLSYRTILRGDSEESYPNFEDRLVSINDLRNFQFQTPIFVFESSDPILCYPEGGGYGIARKHRIYFDVNTLLILYDGFPSFRFFVYSEKF